MRVVSCIVVARSNRFLLLLAILHSGQLYAAHQFATVLRSNALGLGLSHPERSSVAVIGPKLVLSTELPITRASVNQCVRETKNYNKHIQHQAGHQVKNNKLFMRATVPAARSPLHLRLASPPILTTMISANEHGKLIIFKFCASRN